MGEGNDHKMVKSKKSQKQTTYILKKKNKRSGGKVDEKDLKVA